MKNTLLIGLLLMSTLAFAQNVSISSNINDTPDPSAMLDVKSDTKGMLVPRMTLAKRVAIVLPAEGLIVYQTDDVKGFYYYTGSEWTAFVATNKITNYGSGQIITTSERNLLNSALQTETDPLYNASIAKNITNAGSGLVITTAERNKLNAIEANADNIPVGTIFPYAGATLPAGWLWCDGSLVLTSSYPDLYGAIGNAWGVTGSSFNLPDLRGYFMRGVDYMKNTFNTGTGLAGNDPDGTIRTIAAPGGNAGNLVGSKQTDENKTHNHTGTVGGDGSHVHTIPFVKVGSNARANGTEEDWIQGAANGVGGNGAHSHTVTINDYTGKESRPKNVNVNYIIKY